MPLKNTIQFVMSLGLLYACLLSAKFIVLVFHISLPAPLLAMFMVLILLFANIIKPHWLAPACKPILKYMALFFIPAGVGVIQYGSLLTQFWPALLSALIIVPTIGLILVGLLANKGQFHD